MFDPCVQVQIAALRTARTLAQHYPERDAAQVTLAIRPAALPLHSHRPTARSSDAFPSESILVSTFGRLQQTVRRDKGQMVERASYEKQKVPEPVGTRLSSSERVSISNVRGQKMHSVN